MSAGALGLEREASLDGKTTVSNRPTMRAGYTRISSGTIHRLVAAIAAEALHVPLRTVRAGVRDELGQVSVSLAAPLNVPVAAAMAGAAGFPKLDGGTVFERAAAARSVVTSRIEALSGAAVSRVDIRFTGIHNAGQAVTGQATTGRVQ